MLFPLEIWREIVDWMYSDNERDEEYRRDRKPLWNLFEGIASSCQALRQTVLTRWFFQLCLSTEDDVNQFINIWPNLKSRVKLVHLEIDLSKQQPNLSEFKQLNELRIDCDDTKGEFAAPDFEEFLKELHIENLRITSLDIRNLTWPDSECMSLIAEHFPLLHMLKMSQNNIWCGLCNTCSFVSFDTRSDQCLIYEKGEGLPAMYASRLAPLKYLNTVIIDCPLYAGDIPFDPFAHTIHWSGECEFCMTHIQNSTDFQDLWMGKKLGLGEKDALPKCPPSLQLVIWNLLWDETAPEPLDEEEIAHFAVGEEENTETFLFATDTDV